MYRRSFLGTIPAAALLGAGLPQHASGREEFPSRTLRLIVPLAPGGGTDVVSRLVANEFGRILGQSMVVENQSGASGTIGMTTVIRALPDGYTLLTGTPSLSINPSLRSDMKFDPLKDLQPVSLLTRVPYVLVASTASKFKSVQELLTAAKAAPGTITIGSPGIGSGGHLAAELFQLMAGIKLVHIPYKGTSPAMIDLRGGRIDLLFGTTPAVAQFVKSGLLVGLGMTSMARAPILPDMPTINESGVPGFETYSWYGIWAPAKTPRAIVDRLNETIRTALRQPNVLAAIKADGGEPEPASPEDTGQFLANEIAKWRKVIVSAGIKPE